MGARNQVDTGLWYRPASLCSLATQFQTRFLESIPRPIAGLKIQTLFVKEGFGRKSTYFPPSQKAPPPISWELAKNRFKNWGFLSGEFPVPV